MSMGEWARAVIAREIRLVAWDAATRSATPAVSPTFELSVATSMGNAECAKQSHRLSAARLETGPAGLLHADRRL
jgi:hypothetical protein